jgi:hypothetical protein
VTAYRASLGGPDIQQDGYGNSARTSQANSFESVISIQQLGSGNLADATQTGDFHSTSIDQNGSNNRAKVIQAGPTGVLVGNSALVAQVGNSNSATVRQVGEVYVANIGQVGSGNWTSIYQH